MTMQGKHLRSQWSVGGENPRESHRFRYPIYSGESSFPWIALFETKETAQIAAQRYNDYPQLLAEIANLRNELIEASKKLEELQ